jgi:hypothetical protein
MWLQISASLDLIFKALILSVYFKKTENDFQSTKHSPKYTGGSQQNLSKPIKTINKNNS